MRVHIAKCWRRGSNGGRKGMTLQSARAMLGRGLEWLRRGEFRLTKEEKTELLQDILETPEPISIRQLTVEQCRLAIVRLLARGWLSTEYAWVKPSKTKDERE